MHNADMNAGPFCLPKAILIHRFVVVVFFALMTVSPSLSLGQQNPSGKNKTPVNATSKLKNLEAELSKREARHKAITNKARKIAREEARIQRRLMLAGRRAKQREETLFAAEENLAKLTRREQSLRNSLLADRRALSQILGALSRLSRRSEPILVAKPGDVLDRLRSSRLFAGIVPELQARGRNIQVRLGKIDELRLNISNQKVAIAKAQDRLKHQQTEIASLLRVKSKERQRLQDRAVMERRRLELLAVDAKDLRDLITKIRLSARSARAQEARIQGLKEQQKQAALTVEKDDSANATATRDLDDSSKGSLARLSIPFSQARGKVQLPTGGPIVRRFGEDDGHGIKSKGLRIAIRNGAQVVAPYDGEIAYAGSFRGYGQLLIIAHGEGYHSLISGLSRVHVVVGQLVLANEPIGEVKQPGKVKRTLYIELRRKGEAINPLPWMAARKGKVNG